MTLNPGDHIPIGLIYTNQRPAYDDLVLAQQAAPLRDHALDPLTAGELYDRFPLIGRRDFIRPEAGSGSPIRPVGLFQGRPTRPKAIFRPFRYCTMK